MPLITLGGGAAGSRCRCRDIGRGSGGCGSGGGVVPVLFWEDTVAQASHQVGAVSVDRWVDLLEQIDGNGIVDRDEAAVIALLSDVIPATVSRRAVGKIAWNWRSGRGIHCRLRSSCTCNGRTVPGLSSLPDANLLASHQVGAVRIDCWVPGSQLNKVYTG